jgi:hypothetical protein
MDFKHVAVIISLLTLTSCSTMQGTIENNTYISKDRTFKLNLPSSDMAVKDGTTVGTTHNVTHKIDWVDITGRAEKAYFANVYSISYFYDLNTSPRGIQGIEDYLKFRMDKYGRPVEMTPCKFTSVNQDKAYQCVITNATGNPSVVMVGTGYIRNKHLIYAVAAQFFYDKKASTNGIQWNQYDALMRSIQPIN